MWDTSPSSRANTASCPEEAFHFLENYLVFSFIICVACGICVQVTDSLFFLHRMKEMIWLQKEMRCNKTCILQLKNLFWKWINCSSVSARTYYRYGRSSYYWVWNRNISKGSHKHFMAVDLSSRWSIGFTSELNCTSDTCDSQHFLWSWSSGCFVSRNKWFWSGIWARVLSLYIVLRIQRTQKMSTDKNLQFKKIISEEIVSVDAVGTLENY